MGIIGGWGQIDAKKNVFNTFGFNASNCRGLQSDSKNRKFFKNILDRLLFLLSNESLAGGTLKLSNVVSIPREGHKIIWTAVYR